MKRFYDCKKCPAYCCSYDRIVVTRADIRRLARHFGIGVENLRRRFTKAGTKPGERILRQKADPHFGRVCRFLDTETRLCTVYGARPAICRDFPGGARCGYYDFLTFERRLQNDPEWIAKTW